jgi:hypothetical protein
MELIKPETIAASRTYEYVSPVAPLVASKVGVLWPMAKDVFADLQQFFTNIDEYLQPHVDTHR